MRLLNDLITLALVLAAAAVGGNVWLSRAAERPGPLAEAAVVDIAPGANVRAVARLLEARGVVDSAFLFEVYARLRGEAGALRAGEYEMPAGVALAGALARIAGGEAVVRRLTVPEGLTSAQIAALLDAREDLSGTLARVPEEGSLMPDTYHYERGESRAAIVARMEKLARETLERLWAGRAPGLPLAEPRDAVILASIVEKETGAAEERARVAGVFATRLRKGMKLQSDPTVIYAVTGGKAPLGRGLTRAELEIDSPYNTYRYPGLPPGPIANPGRAALEAALNPVETGDLFFVADGSGGHAFARTLEEHNRNVARWRRIERERRNPRQHRGGLLRPAPPRRRRDRRDRRCPATA